jgi:2,4-dienoyl-CoA reductase-like NADH-dependent reductase (Old Yellow Enzyme family)
MTSASFPNLMSPLVIGDLTIKNRIFSTGHNTMLAQDGQIRDRLLAYHEARAAGGAGLIVVQVAAIHETAITTSFSLLAVDDSCIPGYRRLAEACHRHDCKVIAQLYHPGREMNFTDDGALRTAYAPSAVRSDRLKVTPRPMSQAIIDEVIAGYGAGARRVREAGTDGVELVASHGYLPSQFLNPRTNHRTDAYGGTFENRLRFTREAIGAVRRELAPGMVLGMRISADEKDPEGLTVTETLKAIMTLAPELDYVNVTAGSSSSLGGAIHIVPPMFIEAGYTAPFAATVKTKVEIPVFVAGRINQPQIAEQVLASGQADMCGMTRAMICDPEIANKAASGRGDDIRACIGCNQACIGHFHLGCGISCIQHPETGREVQFGHRSPAPKPKRIIVAGGGPAGMKAAAVAAERGHNVTLYEAAAQLGGQALLAQLLPGRAEFGGIVTNLEREMILAGVTVVKGVAVDSALVEQERPDAVVVATGAEPHRPQFEGGKEAHVVDAWQVLEGRANVGGSVVIADWRSDWIGLGLAEKLARDGCRVRLAVSGLIAGERAPSAVRDMWNATLQRLGVEITPYANLYGADKDTIYMMHAVSGEPLVFEDVDTLVLAQGHDAVDSLVDELSELDLELHMAGDCLSPRTAEEAVYEGLKVGVVV